MCGIVAVVGEHQGKVHAIVEYLAHRGPDSKGVASFTACTLAVTRLAIMDPDPRSDQPMEFAGTALVYNGEIYNFAELRRDLERRGHRFTTTGDTEVVLHAAVEWGVEGACERLEGMFAFALWEEHSRSLHLARDSYGIKPLYWLGDGDGLVAASEATPLAAVFGLRPRIDAIREFLRFGSPVTDVAYEKIAELEPGNILTWHDRTVRIRPCAGPATAGSDPTKAASRSIAGQVRSDRPAALFLSGGFDSAYLAAMTSRTGAPVAALTLATRDNREDVRLAIETAHRYGLRHEVVELDERDLALLADEFLEAIDQPTADGFNTFIMARAAVDRGFPVALSGLGGDEALGGYGYSRRLRQVLGARRAWGLVPKTLRPRAAAVLAPLVRQPPSRLEAVLDAPSVAAMWTVWRRLFDDEEIRQLTGAPPAPSARWLTREGDSIREQIRYLDFTVYLRSTLLRDTDVFSMANSVEVRVPFLDTAFVRSAEHRGLTKHELARLTGDEWLQERARAPKLSFALPWERWLSVLAPRFTDLLAGGGPFGEVVDMSVARRLLADDAPTNPARGLRRWALLVLASWLSRDPAVRRPEPRPA